MSETPNESLLRRIADALDRISPPSSALTDFSAATAYVWHADETRLEPVPRVNRVPIALLKGIDQSRDTLLDNTRRFAQGLPANNALLWGARGMGKSSLIKAVHAKRYPPCPGFFPCSGMRQTVISSSSATICRLTDRTTPTNR